MTRRLRLLLAGLLITGFGALCLGAWAMQHATLRAPQPTVWLADRHGKFLLAGHPSDATGEQPRSLGFWPVKQRPPKRIVAATLAIEDRAFFDHGGVELSAVARAVWQNVKAGRRISGASTLAMQVARMQRPQARTWSAKITEAATAIALVQRNGHDAVLAHYLRLAPYGNNVHGAGFAARWYFDKPLADLSWAEAAFLAGLPQAPGRMNPYTKGGLRRATARAHRVLDALAHENALDRAALALARAELNTLSIRPRPERPAETLHAALRLAALPGPPDRRASLDFEVQTQVIAAIESAMPDLLQRGAQEAAAMVIDTQTWQVRAAVGSRDWAQGALDFTRIPRSPGSVLKPFIFASAVEQGLIDQTTVLDDLARTRDEIGNADGRFLGPMLPAMALANSRNVPAVHLVDRLGVPEVFDLFRRLGLHAETSAGQRYGLGLAVGALPTRMIDTLTAYTALAGDGRLRTIQWFAEAASTPGPRIFRESTVRQIAGFLSDPQARLPSFPRMGHSELPFPAAVKTGTSAAWRDAWTVAYSERFLVGVWVGRPDGQPMQRITGYRAGARIAKQILLDLHPESRQGLSDLGFRPPAGWQRTAVCALSGYAPTAACDAQVHVHRAPNSAPLEPCEHHVRLRVDARTGLPAMADTPLAMTEARTFVDLPDRYASWMQRRGLKRPPYRRPAQPVATATARVNILEPLNGTEVIRDPEAPDGVTTLALRAAAPPDTQVLWEIDGAPIAVSEAPHTLRWPVEAGAHTILARIALTNVEAKPVRIVVR
jgi:penicillin-binding protein 1C